MRMSIEPMWTPPLWRGGGSARASAGLDSGAGGRRNWAGAGDSTARPAVLAAGGAGRRGTGGCTPLSSDDSPTGAATGRSCPDAGVWLTAAGLWRGAAKASPWIGLACAAAGAGEAGRDGKRSSPRHAVPDAGEPDDSCDGVSTGRIDIDTCGAAAEPATRRKNGAGLGPAAGRELAASAGLGRAAPDAALGGNSIAGAGVSVGLWLSKPEAGRDRASAAGKVACGGTLALAGSAGWASCQRSSKG